MAIVPTVRLQKSMEINLNGCRGPYLRLTCDVINELTGDLVRRAVAEFYDEGKDVHGNDRRITSTHLEFDTRDLSITHNSGAVSEVDNVVSEWPPDIKAELELLADLRVDGESITEFEPEAEELVTNLTEAFAKPEKTSTGKLWNCWGIGGIAAA